MSNYVVENRALLEAVTVGAQRLGIEVKTFSDDWVIRLQHKGQQRFIFGYRFDINSDASAAIAIDKVATADLLIDMGVAAVPHYLLSTILNRHINPLYLKELLEQYKSLVIKPLKGSRGELISQFSEANHILEFTNHTIGVDWAASPFVNISREIRLIILDDTIQLTYEKHTPVTINGLKMYNLNLGAKATGLELKDIPQTIQLLAIHSMQAIGLQMGAVDIIFDDNNVPYVLEINSGFSLEHFALISPHNRALVINFYSLVMEELFRD